MDKPYINSIAESRDMVTYFQGYNHTDACNEGAFYEMQNISTENYPAMSVRKGRKKGVYIDNPQGLLDKESLIWVAGSSLVIDGEAVSGITLSTSDNMTPKTLAKMGAYVVIFPDNIYYNVDTKESGNIDNVFDKTISTSFTLVNQKGEAITWHDESYYTTNAPSNGDYKMVTADGKTSLSIYSASTKLWSGVATTYFKIAATGIGKGFKAGDGVKVTVDSTSWSYATTLFVNDEGSNKRSNNFVIKEQGDNYIIVTGLLDANKTLSLAIKVERKAPEIAFVTECQNRLWACSKDGHEIYCCKLGDITNWNCFAGISTDSYMATIGTDGKFTGAFTYLGYPIFFKEDSLIRVTVSSTGAHQTKDLNCRGVQAGSEKSLVMVDELLYYKSGNDICVYDGSFPQTISEALGECRYKNAVGGSIDSRYYLCMQDVNDKWNIFVYDVKKKLWSKEDNAQVKFYARHADKLYFIGADNYLYECGSEDNKISWSAESGNIGFALPDKKVVSRINLRMQLSPEAHARFYVQYDSDGIWRFVCDMAGKGTKTFTFPLRPARCDHFKYKLEGKGNMKLYSVTKILREGSDI